MADPLKTAQFMLRHKTDFEIKGNRPIYTCKKCGETRERKPGELETTVCEKEKCGGTMQVHFSTVR